MQKIIIIGRLTKDPVKYVTTSGKVCAQFDLVDNERRGDQEIATYYRCTAWERKANAVLQYCKKGNKLYVEGRASADAYISKKSGEAVAQFDVNVHSYEFLDPKRSDADEEGYKAEANDGMTVVPDEGLPF